jgi:asparagine synthase (glutamine-hydrolysing)
LPEKYEDKVSTLRELLADSCRLRLRSDVNVATCLSGGLDSSSIVSLIHNLADNKLEKRFNHYQHKSFLASFPGTAIDERHKAEKLSARLGLELDILDVQAPDQDELIKAMKACDGPMHSLAFYPIWKLYQHIGQNGIKVTLDGQGPDEMMGGYRPLREGLLSAIHSRKFQWAIDVYNIYASQGESEQFSSRKYARYTVKQIAMDLVKNKFNLRKLVTAAKQSMSINDHLPRRDSLIEDYFYHSFFSSPLPAILNQFDRCSMANGVECRMPFMDYRIVEFIFSLSSEMKVGNGYTKRILRDAMKDTVPDFIRQDRTKIGFNAPVIEWFKGPLKTFVLDTINSSHYLESGYFNGKELKTKFEKYIQDNESSWDVPYSIWPSIHITWWIQNKNLK